MPDWNIAILLALLHVRTPLGVGMALGASQFGGPIIITAVFLVAAYVLSRGKPWAHALGLILALGGTAITSELLKNVLQFDRPDTTLWAVPTFDYGFPSMHSASAMALYGYLIWYVWEKAPRWGVPATLVFGLTIAAVGFSRLYLGIHWPIDVLGGYLLGSIFIVIGIWLTRKLEAFEE